MNLDGKARYPAPVKPSRQLDFALLRAEHEQAIEAWAEHYGRIMREMPDVLQKLWELLNTDIIPELAKEPKDESEWYVHLMYGCFLVGVLHLHGMSMDRALAEAEE